MKWSQKLLGVLCVLAGVVPPHLLYSAGNGGDYGNTAMLPSFFAIAIMSFAVFAVCRSIFTHEAIRICIGTVTCYLLMIAMYVAYAIAFAEFPSEALMWLPVAVIFAIPYMAPLVAMAYAGSYLVFGNLRAGAGMRVEAGA